MPENLKHSLKDYRGRSHIYYYTDTVHADLYPRTYMTIHNGLWGPLFSLVVRSDVGAGFRVAVEDPIRAN